MRKFPGRLSGRFSRHSGFLLIIIVMLSATLLLSAACTGSSERTSWEAGIQPDFMGTYDNFSSGFIVIEMPEDNYHNSDILLEDNYEDINGIGPLPATSFRDNSIILEEKEITDKPDVPFQKGSARSSPDLELAEVENNEDDNISEAINDSKETGVGSGKEEVILEEETLCWTEYHVKEGETLTDICKTIPLSSSQIADANKLTNPDYLKKGQLLLIPRCADDIDDTMNEITRRREAEIERRNRVVPLKVNSYTVQEGDSLWSISNKLNITIDSLFASNELKDPDYLKPGRKLRIPNQDGLFYKVKKGDTLGSIAEKFKTESERITRANPEMDLKVLKVDTEFFIPGATPAASVFSLSDGRTSSYSRGFRWPVAGRINSPFGWRRHPITRKRNFHTGIDIKARTGSIIRASRNGSVAYAGWMGGYGRVVVVNHGSGYSTLYAHCSRLLVRKGQKISSGQAIAKSGSSGRTTGPHLHFEVRQNNKPVNPLKVLK